MLGDAPLSAILPVVDLSKAKAFYGGTLGLKQLEESDSGEVMYQAGAGTILTIYRRPSPTKADHTAVGFMVDDLKSAMARLRAKGVKFEEYDIPEMGLKTVDGVATLGKDTGAWFKDPDGNILSVFQRG
jgi:catechol 2,3-dioxygenase-like lactoylglutathione lyase family enzyme